LSEAPVRHCVSAAVLGTMLALPFEAEAASCSDYSTIARSAARRHVEALRLIEREAADRVSGLDTRSYAWLGDQARLAVQRIGEALPLVHSLAECHDLPPVREVCLSAATALAGAIDQQAAGAATATSKATYGEAMAKCEGFMGLTPLKTAFRQ
jgi:hypothetical protein